MIIVGENVLLYSVDPICWLASQTLVVFLHPGGEVLEPFNLPRSHVDGAEQGERARGALVEVDSRKSWWVGVLPGWR